MSLPLPPPKQSKRKRRRSPKKQSKYEFTNNDNPFREPPTNSSKDQKVSHIFNQNINSNINKNPNTFDDLFTSFQSNPSSIPPKPEVKIDDAVIQDGPGWNDEIESVSVEQNEIENENDATTDTTTTETLDRQYIIKKLCNN